MSTAVSIKNLYHSYHSQQGETDAINNISLDVEQGEFISIVGPSGCGKSTLLSLIAGLIPQSKGEININNGNTGYMLQKDHLFSWRTIEQNILLGLEIQNKLTPENIQYALSLLKQYDLFAFKDKYPYELSGGMRQRVALIRTLAVKPDILLLDEPFSALDYQTRLYVSDEIGRIIKNEEKTAILVTHDISEAISMSDRVIVLTKRPAKIKSEHIINLSIENKTPLRAREAPEFKDYFNTIWKELDFHV